MSDFQTLGSEIRAARLGFRWSNLADGYVRVSPDGTGFLIECRSPAALPSSPKRDGEYFCWWEAPPSVRVALEQLAKGGTNVYLDSDGKRV